ncbi:MAG: glyoxylase-like metal-dependent hydrolase (beta-lactamase superfamily II) [Arenicella sp.]|jgi:glyoxylase-like metal-dependent hydrolase (beta-lactamase superfamily II)
MVIKSSLFIVALLLSATANAAADIVNKDSKQTYADLATAQWLHGAKSCKKDTNPTIQVMQADASTYVLRQNKCITFEAPFIYVLFGQDKVLVVDTGANQSPEKSPVYQTVQTLIQQQTDLLKSTPEILVVHSHSHSDHSKGDSQFVGKPGVEVVDTNQQALERQLGLGNWPNTQSSIDLGGRILKLIPIPGHQEQSIAIYDQQTQWLLSGDSLYPGSIRVKNWDAYKSSIQRLFEFSQRHPIELILGAHIEFNAETKKTYRIGTTYQPNETPLGLHLSQLKALNDKLQVTEKPKKLKFEWLVISPLSRFEKLLSKALS